MKDEKEFFDKAKHVAKELDADTYQAPDQVTVTLTREQWTAVSKAIDVACSMKETDEYKVCSLEEAEAFAAKRMNEYEFAHDLANELMAGSEWSLTAQALLRKQADRIRELENQLDKCSHHEAMAHQGGYEVGYKRGYAVGLKAMSRT